MKQIADIVSNYNPISKCQRVAETVRQAYLSATDYNDGQHYAALTDLTGVAALTNIHRRMLRHPIGRCILTQKPRITDSVLESLVDCKQDTFGKGYYKFMMKYGFKPSDRPLVQYVPDLELAYVSQRYKEIHDFLHVILLDEVTVHNQLVVKWFEMIQLGLPSAALAVLVSPILSDKLTLAETASICRLANKYRFVMNFQFEKHFDMPLNQLRVEMQKPDC